MQSPQLLKHLCFDAKRNLNQQFVLQATKKQLEKQLHEHKRQISKEKAKLNRMTTGLQMINFTYDAVFKKIDDREIAICQQVNRNRHFCWCG